MQERENYLMWIVVPLKILSNDAATATAKKI